MNRTVLKMKSKVKRSLHSMPFLMSIVRKIRKFKEGLTIRRLNRRYRNTIAPLYDENVLAKRISEVDFACKTPDKATFFIVSQSNETVGIFGYINVFLPHIAYAVAKGWIPVIDMESHRYIYTPKGKKKNVWEMFFEQPCGFGLKDLSGKKTIRCAEELWYHGMPNTCPLMSEQDIRLWSELFSHFIRPNAESLRYLEEEERAVLKDPNKTVGVIYRGTTYTKGQAKGHPIQPTMKMLAEQVRKTMNSQNCEWVYLASDEKSIVDYMVKAFPGKVLINKRVYYDEVENVDYSEYNESGTDITGDMFDRPDNNYLIGIEYISSINLVANCVALVAGACGGTTAALYMNGRRYRERYIFELGKYGIDPVPED